MKHLFLDALVALATMITACPIMAAAATALPIAGSTWINPHSTVAVKTGTCSGNKLCGWIVWASPKALQDAQSSGIARLIGTELLQDYEPTGHGRWSGTVYVPDMGGHFSSTITPVGDATLQIKGCLIGGFFCKAQIWRRVDQAIELHKF